MRKPYAGYITKLGNLLTTLTVDPKVDGFFNTIKEWQEYIASVLAIENERNESALGGRKGVSASRGTTQVEDHLAFESNLVDVFQRLKQVKFDPDEPAPENPNDSVEYYDAEYWKEDQLCEYASTGSN